MLDWLVIGADAKPAGRGVRGMALVWFLRTYFGRQAVRYVEPNEYCSEDGIAAETVFLGLPTSLAAEEIEEIPNRSGCKRIVAFNYFDEHELAWSDDQAVAFRKVGEVYLKPWKEPVWATLPEYAELKMGTLPIRRYGRFTWARRLDRWKGWFAERPEPKYDVAFLGRPNHTQFIINGEVTSIDQRVEWMLELKRNAPELKVWGGLVEVNEKQRQSLAARHGEIDDLLYDSSSRGSKVNFATYWQNIRRSRVLLAPGGNVPWTYRHYECLYAGAAVATLDFRDREMLVPMPTHNMTHVPVGESCLPAVREAMEMYQTRPGLGDENIEFLETYLKDAAYSRSRAMLVVRFMEQLK